MEGDILSRMILNISDFKTKLGQIERMLSSTVSKIERASVKASRGLTESVEDFEKRSSKAAGKYSRSWWDSFGRVALGFTVAYRAMNAFEVGVRKVIDTIKDAITESSELASTQAKLAFWYQMHTDEMLTYAEVFQRASVNIKALGEASVYSVATLEELTTGIDELAQSVGSVPAKMIPAMASMVDFTVMVAQTTGSTIRQVRQEFQALMEGRIKTTDVMARALVKTGIMSREELAQMRAMQNQAEILEKVMNAVHERWAEARDIYREASLEAAKGFWEKALRMNIRLSVELASEMTKTGEVAGNLFAKVFVKHGVKSLEDMKAGLNDNVVMMLALRDVLDKVLTALEKTLAGLSWFIAGIYRMSDEVIFAVKALGGLLIVGAIAKLINGLGKAVLWLAVGPFKILLSSVRLLNTAFLRIPIILYASVIAVQAFFRTLKASAMMTGEDLLAIFAEIPKALSGMFSSSISMLKEQFAFVAKFWWDKLPKSIQKAINFIVKKNEDAGSEIEKVFDTTMEFWKDKVAIATKFWEDKLKGVYEVLKTDGSDFAKEYGKNFKAIVLEHLDMLTELMAPIWDKLTGDQKENYAKMLEEAKKYLNGLDWIFKEGAEKTKAQSDAETRRLRQIASLRLQMEKDFFRGRLARIKMTADAELEIRLLRIRELTKAGIVRDELEDLAARAHAEKMIIIHGSMVDSLKRGISKYLDTVKTKFEITRDSIKQVLTDLESTIQTTMGDTLYDAFTGQLKSIEDYYKAFARSFLRAWSNMISELITETIKLYIIKRILGLAGGMASGTAGMTSYNVSGVAGAAPMVGGVAHKGGTVGETSFPMRMVPANLFENAVRLHNGLAADEFPAILQKGELVTPRDEARGIQEKAVQVDIVNVFDEILFDRYLATSRGQDAILNVIGTRSQSIRRVIR